MVAKIEAPTFAEAVQAALEFDAPLNERLGMVADQTEIV